MYQYNTYILAARMARAKAIGDFVVKITMKIKRAISCALDDFCEGILENAKREQFEYLDHRPYWK